ncbi:MAG: hypothetical protein ACC651_12145 [Candidatus Scalindua sp.]
MVSRRNFILGGVLVAGSAAVGIQFYRGNILSPGEKAVNAMIERLARLPGTARFAEMFLKQQLKYNHAASSVRKISVRLFKDEGNLIKIDGPSALDKQVKIELRQNQFYLVDDWYLTHTEADLCVLASEVNSVDQGKREVL